MVSILISQGLVTVSAKEPQIALEQMLLRQMKYSRNHFATQELEEAAQRARLRTADTPKDEISRFDIEHQFG